MYILPVDDSLLKKLFNIKAEYAITLTFSGFNRNGLRNTSQQLAIVGNLFIWDKQ